jgi:hypothetical protein
MNNTCLVLGAGFSNAVSNLPITKEMVNAFQVEIERQRSLNNTNRVKWGEHLLNFLDKLENEFLKTPYAKAEEGGKILKSNYSENFEGLCSFIDLNLAFEVQARCESNGIKAGLSGKPLFVNYTSAKLKQIRGYLKNYLFLTLIHDNSNEELLNRIHNLFFNIRSSIITFNYDLILEKFLFKKNYWFPKDGYGFTPKDLPALSSNYFNQSSRIKIFKMHGSLNWEPSSFYLTNLQFKWSDDDDNYFFPKYLKEEKKKKYRYQGAIATEGWILPSWIKQFTFNEIIQVWNQAFKALNKADEIIFIGYSLPRADSAVYSLFSSIDWNNKIVKLIDPNAEELKDNYSFVLRKSDIEIIPVSLEEYLK